MAKDPAFLFYPNDWIGGTMGMTFEEKGAYMELLMLQFNRGHMTKHMMGQTVGRVLDKIMDKFVLDEIGLYYNERLEYEKDKRKSFVSSRKNNISGKNQYSKIDGHMTSLMENENKEKELLLNGQSNLSPKMIRIYKESYPQYPINLEEDFKQCLEIGYKIAKQKGWSKESVLNGNMDKVLEVWTKIVVFTAKDNWLSTRTIKDLNTPNEWGRLIKAMTSKPKKLEEKAYPTAAPLRRIP